MTRRPVIAVRSAEGIITLSGWQALACSAASIALATLVALALAVTP